MLRLLILIAAFLPGSTLNAQIGLLETNNTMKNKDVTVVIPFDTSFSNYDRLFLRLLDQVERRARIDSQNITYVAQRLLVELARNEWNYFVDSIAFAQKAAIVFKAECVSADYKMWNYFTRFEDSNQVVSDYVGLVDSLADAYSRFDTLTKRADKIRDDILNMEAEFYALRDSITKWSQPGALQPSDISPKDSIFKMKMSAVKAKKRFYDQLLKKCLDTLKEHQLIYNRIITFFFKKKQVTKSEEKKFGALPQVTAVIGERETVPGIQLLGTKRFGNTDKDFLTGEMGLLLGMQSNPEKPNLKTLFVEEASTFHLYTYFNYGFGAVGNLKDSGQKRLAINLHISYSMKKILTDTLETTKIITPSLFHTQAGLELAIFVNSLSIYGNINTLSILDKVKEFKAGLAVDRKFYGYIDCGAKIFLDPEPALGIKNAKLFVNANFIVNSGDVRYVTKSDDSVIPNIQIGIKASF